MTGSAFKTALLAMSLLLSGAIAGHSGNMISGGLPSLNPPGILTMGGVTGGYKTDPGARKCYGSTLCKDSGNYYSEEGILHYKNGDPLVQHNTTRKNGSAIGDSAQNKTRHQQWCSGQYRSYRASDNSYQPYNGARRSCTSPY